MRIAIVTKHCCVRVLKQATVLREQGHELWVITNRMGSTGLFDTVLHWGDIHQLVEGINRIKDDVDLFHVHNEPNFPVMMIRQAAPDVPIVLDMHDSNYWRLPENHEIVWHEEEIALQAADACVFPSASTQARTTPDMPTAVIHSASPLAWYRYWPTGYKGAAVYEGGIQSPHHPGVATEDLKKDYGPLFEQLCQAGKRVHAYSDSFTLQQDEEPDKYYLNLQTNENLQIGKQSHQQLLELMGQYDWNILGNINGHVIWDINLPNKLFDGMAAGVPTVSFHCQEANAIIQEHDIGLTVETAEELLDRWDEHLDKRHNLWLHREDYAMEQEIPKLERLYEQVTAHTYTATPDDDHTPLPQYHGNGEESLAVEE